MQGGLDAGWAVHFIIEFDGVVVDVAAAYHRAHERVAAELGWSRLDRASFWRLTRTKGAEADLLPGAPSSKVNAYRARFEQLIETDEVLDGLEPHAGMDDVLGTLGRFGRCSLTTIGSNLASRRAVLEGAGLAGYFTGAAALSSDARRRVGELSALAAGDERTIVAAGTVSIVRSAGAAELIAVGIAGGSCTAARLHRAGADMVYQDWGELSASVRSGGRELIRAGLLPPALGG